MANHRLGIAEQAQLLLKQARGKIAEESVAKGDADLRRGLHVLLREAESLIEPTSKATTPAKK